MIQRCEEPRRLQLLYQLSDRASVLPLLHRFALVAQHTGWVDFEHGKLSWYI
jgi:hypothetical protein